MSEQSNQLKIPQKKYNKSVQADQFIKNEHKPIKQMNDEIQDEVFLRNDVNQLFDNMMVNSNFNLKKYNKIRHNRKVKNNEVQQNDRKNSSTLLNSLRAKMTTEPIQQIFNDGSINSNKKRNSRVQTQTIENNQKKLHKGSILNTTNLDKLLRKNEFKTQYNQTFNNKSMTTDFNKTTFDPRQGKSKSKYQILQSSDQKSQKGKLNVRKKIISFGSHKNQQSRKNDSFSVDIRRNSTMGLSGGNTKLQARKNKYEQLQKFHNKNGPLKFKSVQNWLNNIIQEYCHQQYFDTSLTCAALKKYYIDSNSLMSNGVQPKDVARIYNSLFVYSIGFNNLIKQISKGNKELVKNIWKVYSLLIEYCAAGYYETLIGEIERDKVRKVEQLKVQIEKRQEIIQKNQSINQEKNIYMVRELKRLKDQNINLANQREILLEDFQLADQAFTEEVSLRLKFQNTINQIYGVHKQLSNKHGRLYHDFQQKIQQLKRASQKYFQQTKLAQKFKFQLLQLKQKHNQMKKINSHDKQHIEVLLIQLSKMKQNYFITLKQLQQTRYINIQKQRKLQQMQTQLKNNMLILQMRQKSAKQTHTEYQITLEENNKLFKVISEQRTEMEILLKQKKQFNSNVLKIISDSSYYKKKLENAEKQVKQLKEKKIQLEILVHKFDVNTDILNKEIQACKRDLQSNYQNIQKMHKTNFQLQQQLQYLRRFQNNIDRFMQEKNSQLQIFKIKAQTLQKDLQKQRQDFINLQSQYKILDTQFKAQHQSSMKKFQQFRKQQQQLNTKQSTISNLLKSTQLQVQRYKQLFKNALTDFKHQKFQRTNLALNYDQMLKVMQKKNAQQKSMSIQINQLQQLVNQYKQKYKLAHLNLKNSTQQFNLKMTHMEDKVRNLTENVEYKVHHIHPMVYEDVMESQRREIQLKESYKKMLVNHKRQAEINVQELQKSIKKLKNDHEYEKDKIIKLSTQIKQKLQNELQYEKQQKQLLKNKLGPLQDLQKTYKEKVYLFQQRQNQQQMQEKLMRQIEQKNKKIQSLYQQLEKIHDLNSIQIKDLQDKVKKVQDQKMNFVYEFKTKKQRQMKEQIQRIYEGQMEKMKNQYESKLKNKKNYNNNNNNNNTDKQQHSRQVSGQDFDYQFKEYIKKKNLDEILLIKKQQIQNSQQSQKNHFFSQIQDFFKREMNIQSMNLFKKTSISFGRKNENKNDKIPGYLKRIQNQSEQIRKRTQVSRKLKLTYQYYGKNVTTQK